MVLSRAAYPSRKPGAEVRPPSPGTVIHIHVIPRYEGDVDDPRGGIRWVLPERAAWWEGEP